MTRFLTWILCKWVDMVGGEVIVANITADRIKINGALHYDDNQYYYKIIGEIYCQQREGGKR
jgi:hypothetical protein